MSLTADVQQAFRVKLREQYWLFLWQPNEKEEEELNDAKKTTQQTFEAKWRFVV